MSRLTPKAWLILVLVLLGGGFVLWLQLSLMTSLAALGFGARGFQTSMTSAVDQIKAGGFAEAQSDVQAADGAARAITFSSNGPHMALLAGVPGIGTAIENWQHLGQATDGITTSTTELVDLYGDLSGKNGGAKIFSDGAVDIPRLEALPPRVAKVDAGMQMVVAQLEAVNTSGPTAGLLGTLKTKALDTAKPVQEAVSALVGIAPLLPDALGANGVKRYLVAIDNQAEMRAAGGAPLSLALVEFDNGRITIPIKGTTSTQLFPPVNRPVTWWGPGGNPFFATNPRTAPFVVTNTHPSLLTSGREMAGAWAGGDFPTVDGVITLDLTAIGAMLDATGPIQSEVYGEVTGEKLGQILLIDAYAQFGQADADARQAANQQLIDDLLPKLLSGDALVPAAQAVASTAPGPHFQLWAANPKLEQLAINAGTAGEVADPKSGDWSAMYTQNGNQSKVDVFQQRNVVVNVQLEENGSARVTQQMNVTNATPADRPALGTFGKIGYETTWLKAAYIMYVPDAAVNYGVNYPAGFAVRPFTNHKQYGRGFADDGYGQKIVRVVGWTPPGGQASVSVSYQLPAGTFASANTAEPLQYVLRADPQSLWLNSTITVRVTPPAGWAPIATPGMKVTAGTAEVSAVQDAPVNVRIGFQRSGS
ncbi:MAG: DUF4012 domain-containing protein [Candidatus Nanopelagicales bacterium]